MWWLASFCVRRRWLAVGVGDGQYGEPGLLESRHVLKGGNAFRKAYFADTRFSGDLDFAAPVGWIPAVCSTR
jgi:hypothetical protein